MKRIDRRFAPLLCAALLTAAVVGAPLAGQEEREPERAAAPSSSEAGLPDLGIAPGDRVQITVWREPDLNGTYHVDERGDVVLPKLGPVPVGGLGSADARARIQERYAVYLRNPSVEVIVLRRIGVHGEVKAPTLYWVDVTLSVRDAIALAGGVTPDGDPGEISLVREGRTIDLEEARTAALVETGLQSGDQIVVGRRSWVALNAPYVISSAISLLGILSGFLLAG